MFYEISFTENIGLLLCYKDKKDTYSLVLKVTISIRLPPNLVYRSFCNTGQVQRWAIETHRGCHQYLNKFSTPGPFFDLNQTC